MLMWEMEIKLTMVIVSLWLIEYYNRTTWESGVASMMQNSKDGFSFSLSLYKFHSFQYALTWTWFECDDLIQKVSFLVVCFKCYINKLNLKKMLTGEFIKMYLVQQKVQIAAHTLFYYDIYYTRNNTFNILV